LVVAVKALLVQALDALDAKAGTTTQHRGK
jgi:hypothetical protein